MSIKEKKRVENTRKERKKKKIPYHGQRSRLERFESYVDQRKLVSFTSQDHKESRRENLVELNNHTFN